MTRSGLFLIKVIEMFMFKPHVLFKETLKF